MKTAAAGSTPRFSQATLGVLQQARVDRQTRRRTRILVAITLLASMAAAILFSKYLYIHGSLQLDEAQSLWQSSHSIGGTLHVVALDVHVPLYHLMLHFWQLYFGHGVATVRILSMVFFLATIPIVYLLARQVLSVYWALVAVVLFSLSPFMNWYGNVARMYTMLAFFSALSQYYFIRILKKKKNAWYGYGISAVIGAYSHYFFSFNLAVEGIFFLLNRKKFSTGTFKRLMITAVAVGAALAPWLWYFHYLGSASGTRPMLARPSSVDFFNAFSQFLFGFQDNHINTILLSLWPIVMLVGFLAVRRNQRATPEIGFIAMMAFFPVILAFGLSFVVAPFFLSRYLIASVAPLMILIVWLISHYGKAAARAVATALIIGLFISTLQQAYSNSTPVKEDYAGAVGYINRHADARDAVVVSTPFTIYPIEYYYNAPAAITTLPVWNRESVGLIPSFTKAGLPAQVQSISAHHHKVYLLLSYDQGYQHDIRAYYQQHYKQLYRHTYSPGLELYVYQVGYQTVPKL